MSATRLIAAAARLTAVLAAAAALSACDVVVNSLDAKGQAKDQWTKTYTIAPTGDVEIVNANGRIDVTGAEGTQVEVVAERTARAMTDEDAQKVLAQLQIVETVTAGSVRLETKAPKGDGRRVEVTYRVKVPASVNVRLQNSNGTITLAALKGTVTAETDNGTVVGRQLAGAVDGDHDEWLRAARDERRGRRRHPRGDRQRLRRVDAAVEREGGCAGDVRERAGGHGGPQDRRP